MLAKKVANRFLRPPKGTPPQQNATASTATTVNVRSGRCVKQVTYQTIKCFTCMSVVILVITITFSITLFISALTIKNGLGQYINMIASGDGNILPAFQAIPVLIFLILNIILAVIVCKLFHAEESPTLNWFLFLVLMLSVLLMFITFILLFIIMAHIYKAHEELHNGIVDAMKNYSSNSRLKRHIDRLQIEFQCCGSKKYDEWYSISWYDSNLAEKGTYDKSQGNTPFSCCSMSSSFPCIHHNIETTGKVYLYTPELNLSISTKGCYSMLKEKKQEFGWGVIGNLVLYLVLQIILVLCIWQLLNNRSHYTLAGVMNHNSRPLGQSETTNFHNSQGALVMFLRFIQTAHYEQSKFEGQKRLYTIWLVGCVITRNNQESPPEPPPVPPELME